MRLLSVAAARLLSGRGGLQQHRGCCRVIGLCIQRTDCTRLKGTGSCLFGGLFQTRSSDADVQVGKHAPAEQGQLRTHKLDSQELPGRDAHLAPSQLPPQACLVLLEWNHGPATHEHMFSTCWCLHVAMHSLGKLEQLSDQSGLDTKPAGMHSLDGHHAHQQLPTMHIKCWTTSHRPEPKMCITCALRLQPDTLGPRWSQNQVPTEAPVSYQLCSQGQTAVLQLRLL